MIQLFLISMIIINSQIFYVEYVKITFLGTNIVVKIVTQNKLVVRILAQFNFYVNAIMNLKIGVILGNKYFWSCHYLKL